MKEEIILAAIDGYADKIRDDFEVPGLAVAVVKNDALILAKGFGVRKLGTSLPVDENTLFGIASISKSFTAMALGMLVDEGKLAWADPVTKHLPSFQLNDPYATRELSVLDLLIHRCGLAPVSGGTLWYGSDYDRQEVVDRIRYINPVSSFRSEYAYQNITYLVAGEIIPALTDLSWDEFVEQRIFVPLEMRSSNTSIMHQDALNNVARPHAVVNRMLREIEARNYDNVGPAASINTSVKELSAYVRLLLGGGKFQDIQLYSPRIARDLWTPHTLIPLPTEFLPALDHFMPGFHHSYALGWFVQDAFGQRKVSHGGGIDGLRSLVTMIPEHQLGLIVFANSEGPAAWIMTNVILDLVRGANPDEWYEAASEQWNEQLLKHGSELPESPAGSSGPSLALEQYSGMFTSKLVGDIEVVYEQDQLSLLFPHTPTFAARLSHWHYDTFRLNWQDPVIPDGLLTFTQDSLGRVIEMRLDQKNLLDVDFAELHPIKRAVD